MKKDIKAAVREVCLSFPESEEVVSRGSPNFKVAGKVFAIFVVNHHGDGRISLWLPASPGAQDHYVIDTQEIYFVPPYVGPRGWLGVNLDKGLSWNQVAQHVGEAFDRVAPKRLSTARGKLVRITPPTESLDPLEVDPLLESKAQKHLGRLREMCLRFPETLEDARFGYPVWRAGKKTFCTANRPESRLRFSFWVGGERQSMLIDDSRYSIPAYTGHNGWILLDVEEHQSWSEIEGLLLESYRHFALKRMLRQLSD